jgi:hypothetical protein
VTIRLPADVLDEVRKIAQATSVRPTEALGRPGPRSTQGHAWKGAMVRELTGQA